MDCSLVPAMKFQCTSIFKNDADAGFFGQKFDTMNFHSEIKLDIDLLHIFIFTKQNFCFTFHTKKHP